MMPRSSAILLTLLVITLTACSSVAIDKKDSQPLAASLISAAEESGDLATAATEYLALAEENSGALRSAYLFRAATVLHTSARYNDAAAALGQIDLQQLSVQERNAALLMQADIALINADSAAALQALGALDQSALSQRQRIRALNFQIAAYQATENGLEKAMAHLALEDLLDGQAQQDNRLALWETLMGLTTQQLDLFNPGQPPQADSGWFALAYIFKAYQGNPEAIEVALENWQLSYPNHPADVAVYRKLTVQTTRLPENIQNIAVLLPESGPIANAANAVKQGIIAAHFTVGSSAQLKFYDVQADQRNTGKNVISQYQKAVNDGAQVVIGPLDKASVEILAKQAELTVPVLALNRVSNAETYDNLLQFGLAPEDDAIAAAHFARSRGYQRALVLGPQSAWGERVTEAFRQAWQQQNGELVQLVRYNERENDFSTELTPMLGIDASVERQRSLRNTLGRSLEFEPRRRQDVDFIFMVATPIKARQLIPQLQFHRAGHLPVIATSHAYNGINNAKDDIDLNNLIIMDIPWMVSENAQTDPAFVGISRQTQDDYGRFIRLAAMGADAYRLLPRINALRSDAAAEFDGATGVLTINSEGKIERAVTQAIFSNGIVKPLTESPQ